MSSKSLLTIFLIFGIILTVKAQENKSHRNNNEDNLSIQDIIRQQNENDDEEDFPHPAATSSSGKEK
jgi:hypothetical protein